MPPRDWQNAGLDGCPSIPTQKMFHRVLCADPAVVRQTLMDIRDRFRDDVSLDTLGRLELVLAEVMNNITEHAGVLHLRDPGHPKPSIHLSIVRHPAGLACGITDDGPLLPAECLQPRNLPGGTYPDLEEGGFGWFLIQDLTQSLCYYREGGRNFLDFSVPFAAS
ncbi:ATP-binding protein [Paracoccus fistulariae]|uniref:ATP-binding protein n=1 Tax=Paracoccus fistulariae TaxID=658446 RepID=A0ABY7SGM3_9RHOB|nr:ATP-binding protein [Paracoccus fistulariae]MDB6182818.1 ATP-binding protein [Paracoccus fistulariae]WCR06167.1 ATP-binding protein [Paracoccus fistulariae]